MHRCSSSSLVWFARTLRMSILALALAACAAAQPSQPAPAPSPQPTPAASAPTATLAPPAPAPATSAPQGAAAQALATPASTPSARPAEQPTARQPPSKGQQSAAQQKIDSNLLAQIQPPFDAAAPLLVDISAQVSDALLERMRARGAEIVAADAPSRSLRARIPAGEIEALAADSDVIFIQLALAPATR